MTSAMLHPGLLVLLGGIALAFLRGRARMVVALAVPAAAVMLRRYRDESM